jgi:hypothetical protein
MLAIQESQESSHQPLPDMECLNLSTNHEIFAFYVIFYWPFFPATLEQFCGTINDSKEREDNSNYFQEDCEIFSQTFFNFFH